MESDKTYSYPDILKTIGNGDFHKGFELLQEIANYLVTARQKHEWGKDKEIDTPLKASQALKSEIAEWEHAINAESEERQHAEALDVTVVAIRLLANEYKNL